jgi:hypothetical protein
MPVQRCRQRRQVAKEADENRRRPQAAAVERNLDRR